MQPNKPLNAAALLIEFLGVPISNSDSALAGLERLRSPCMHLGGLFRTNVTGLLMNGSQCLGFVHRLDHVGARSTIPLHPQQVAIRHARVLMGLRVVPTESSSHHQPPSA